MRILTPIICLVAGLALFLCCSPSGPGGLAGAGSKTPNAFIKGTVTYGTGTGTGGVRVTLFAINRSGDGHYTWSQVDSTWSDSTGSFRFDSLYSGDYSVTVEKGYYEGFSGYFAVLEDDAPYDLGQLVLAPSVSIMGMFQFLNRDNYLVSLVGTADSVVEKADTGKITIPDDSQHRYFVFDAIPVGLYTMKIVLDYQTPGEMSFFIPLPATPDSMPDTTYIEHSYGQQDTISIQGAVFKLRNSFFKLVCFIEQNDVYGQAAAKRAGPPPLFLKEENQ